MGRCLLVAGHRQVGPMSYVGKIPFHPINGNLMTWPKEYVFGGRNADGSYTQLKPVWRDNYVFKAVLYLDRQERGRSAAHFILKDRHGTEYTMFMTDLVDVLNKACVMEGAFCEYDGDTECIISVRWTFCKRGQNYGVCLASD